ncbi:hypothetical protein MMC20_000337 [Loxospora ochrophaea]|nr:hypothetical protein [Loxospora ochrophaea]
MTSNPLASDLPPDAIQRVLFLASDVHVYHIPPLTSTKGYTASQWTEDNNKRQIFTARLRILETAIPNAEGTGENVKTDVLLEDPKSGQLFAAVPYTDSHAVESVLDSVRFFAVRVVGDGGRKAMLGIGFEERSEAFDFGIALQEARKVQGIDQQEAAAKGGRKASGKVAEAEKKPAKKDFSLKEGETIHVDIKRASRPRKAGPDTGSDEQALFSIPPPSGGMRQQEALLPLISPPPSAQEVKAEKRRSMQQLPPEPGSMADLGFDDGEFGEFQ